MRKMLATLLVLTPLFTLSPRTQAQIAQGKPAVGNSAGVLVTDGLFVDAAQFAGAPDACMQILNAWAALTGLTSGTVDARSLTGTLTCGVNPFSTTTNVKRGKLLLGNAIFQTTVPWIIPSRVQVQGLGATFDSTVSQTFNTIVLASSSTASPVITMGNQNPSFGVQVRDLTVDCNNFVGCIGIFNGASQEGSILEDVNVTDAPAIGIRITTNATSNGAANSGPYKNIGIQYNTNGACSNCNGSTVGLQVDGTNTGTNAGVVVREFDAVTVSGNNATSQWAGTARGISIFGTSTALTNSHVEFFPVGIQIGGNASFPTNSVQVSNVSIGVNQGGWNIVLGNAGNNPATGDIVLSGITSGSTNNQIVQNNITTHNLNTSDDNFIAFYAVGHCPTTGCTAFEPAVVSSSNNVNWRAAGGITKPSGSFSIDHPLDPANRSLNHSFVESPDMMNIYNGSVSTDRFGLATVTLPDYFEALNQDFRYQLTPLGQFAQAFVAEKIQNNRFLIKTDKPGVEVSWQVTGVRHDAYANSHRIQVEETKPPSLRQH